MPAGYLLGGPGTSALRPAQTNPAYAFNPGLALENGTSSGARGMEAGTSNGVSGAQAQSNLQAPGQNMLNPGYSEQQLTQAQNRLNNDPFAGVQGGLVGQAQQPSAGQNYMNRNLGTLDGPGQGDQYWSQVQGQFQNPFAGEQYARQATQNMSPTGPAGAFFNQAQGQYDQFTGYSGPQASQGQYQANASSGPLAGQNFYDQVGGSYDQMGRYTDPNLAAGQYNQTQGAFGDMPIANFDPFYDRASQLGVQKYNQQASGRGVYGSSEALSGVGNVITDIEAQRANRSFDAEMQRAQEQRMRQQLLGEQARMGDLSSLAAFGANMTGLETYGNLAKTAGEQTLGQQTMLGNQANNVDQNAQAAQNSNIEGVRTYGQLANNADTAETDRYRATTSAMNAADQTSLDRLKGGADMAFRGDENAREDYRASNDAANAANDNRDQAINTASNVAHTGSADELARLREAGNEAHTAEGDRQARVQSQIDQVTSMSRDMANLVSQAQKDLMNGSQQDFENWFNANMAPALQAAGMSQQEQDAKRQALMEMLHIGVSVYNGSVG